MIGSGVAEGWGRAAGFSGSALGKGASCARPIQTVTNKAHALNSEIDLMTKRIRSARASGIPKLRSLAAAVLLRKAQGASGWQDSNLRPVAAATAFNSRADRVRLGRGQS